MPVPCRSNSFKVMHVTSGFVRQGWRESEPDELDLKDHILLWKIILLITYGVLDHSDLSLCFSFSYLILLWLQTGIRGIIFLFAQLHL
jgi:hypothetical protein